MPAKPEPDDLEALFDSIVAQREAATPATPAAAAPSGAHPANESVPPADGDAVFQRIGHLTRALHDALRELGYERKLEQHATALPDAHERLKYVAKLSGDAAERVLGDVEKAQAVSGALDAEARVLDGRWDALMEGRLTAEAFKGLAADTRTFVKAVPARLDEVNGQLSDIMLAQDFHDLSGQVIKRVAEIVQRLENDLLALLLETCPAAARPDEGMLNGPAIPGRGGADVVTDQAQVDHLLESLGF